MVSAVVVGGSLAGLMTGLALARTGTDVTILERSDDSGRTGAALHVDHDLVRRLTGSRTAMPIPSGLQTWHTVHDGLRDAVHATSGVRLLPDTTVVDIGQDSTAAWVIAADGTSFRADFVIGADGHRSTVRKRVAPEHPDATFAGYGIWVGIAAESAIPSRHRWPSDVAFLSSDNGPLLGCPLPGVDGSTAQGHRQLGWAWYDSTRNQLLQKAGAVNGTVVRHSLTGQEVPDAVYEELANEARQFAQPWRDAILDCIERRAIINTPIAEYVPDRLVNGRLALVGDAAHVPTPMTGSGFSESLRDAETLASSLQAVPGDRGLLEYERLRLREARDLVLSGQHFSRRFSRTAAA